MPVEAFQGSVHPSSIRTHRRYTGSQLGPGFLAAHRTAFLVLLPSGPDTVQKILLRKTQPSTPRHPRQTLPIRT